jgi:hypothetical protein
MDWPGAGTLRRREESIDFRLVLTVCRFKCSVLGRYFVRR